LLSSDLSLDEVYVQGGNLRFSSLGCEYVGLLVYVNGFLSFPNGLLLELREQILLHLVNIPFVDFTVFVVIAFLAIVGEGTIFYL
jgi:hypothetical protein